MTVQRNDDEPRSDGGGTVGKRVRTAASVQKAEYEGDTERPLGGFLLSMGAYLFAVGALALVVRRRRRPLPERIAPGDLALLTVATHKLSRLLAKDPVTSPLRAPFTRFAGSAGPGELHEEPRGTGVRKAVGALLTCPFCTGTWVATGFGFGLVLAPRATRLSASVLTVLTGSDVLQFAYSAIERKSSS